MVHFKDQEIILPSSIAVPCWADEKMHFAFLYVCFSYQFFLSWKFGPKPIVALRCWNASSGGGDKAGLLSMLLTAVAQQGEAGGIHGSSSTGTGKLVVGLAKVRESG